MNTYDLMLGDWVADGGENAIVTSLTCDGIIETTRRISNVELVEPIPITPGILEKNGFRFGITETEEFHLRNAGVSCCCQNGYVYEDMSGTIKIIFPKETDGGQIEIYDTKFDRSFCFVWSKDLAVHELQHALRLCGIDKEIML